jgi:hypothetical protein
MPAVSANLSLVEERGRDDFAVCTLAGISMPLVVALTTPWSQSRSARREDVHAQFKTLALASLQRGP